jgi:hypothetical protein
MSRCSVYPNGWTPYKTQTRAERLTTCAELSQPQRDDAATLLELVLLRSLAEFASSDAALELVDIDAWSAGWRNAMLGSGFEIAAQCRRPVETGAQYHHLGHSIPCKDQRPKSVSWPALAADLNWQQVRPAYCGRVRSGLCAT